jgi:hypothetical protein
MPIDRAARITELETDLAGIRDAIRRIVAGGQAYSAEGRMMTRADLRALRDLEKDTADELARLVRGTRGRTYGVVHR